MVTCFSSAETVRIWHKIDKWRNTLSINWTYLGNISLWDWLEPSIEMGGWETNHSREPGPGHQPPEPGPARQPPQASRQWMAITQASILSYWRGEIIRLCFWALIQLMSVYIFLNSYYLTFAVSRAAWLNGPNVTVTFRSCVGKFYQFGWWSLGPGQHSVSCALGT